MKKIKKKKSGSQSFPAFLIGWTHGEPPPPGYLSAWFDQQYGGPLRIRFLSSNGHHHFEAVHTNWKTQVQLAPSPQSLEQWRGRLQWDHPNLAEVWAPSKVQSERQDEVLHVARIVRGLTLLLEGTSYDMATGVYRNPSDWQDLDLVGFQIDDHIQVEHHEQMMDMRMWLHTRGLTKFGLDEIENFQSIGLSGNEPEYMLQKVAGRITADGKNPKVGEQVSFGERGQQVEVIRHRTDPLYGIPLAFREVRDV